MTALKKEDSLVIKGIAVLLMMWSHCFLKGRADAYEVSFFPFTSYQVTEFAEFGRIFVSLFAFVSGYGLYLSYDNRCRCKNESTVSWLWKRYLKSFLPMQFVIVFIWIVTFFLDGMPKVFYFKDGFAKGVLYMLINFFGLSDLFDTPKMVGTWWYLTAQVAFIVLVPVLYSALKRYGGGVCFAILMLIPRCINGYPGGMHFLTFLPALMIGMLFAKHDYLSLIDRYTIENKQRKIGVALLSVLFSVLSCSAALILPKKNFWDLNLGLFTGIYVVMIHRTVCRVSMLSRMLQFIGRHSANVFLTHTLIRNRYLIRFVYSRGHFVLIIFTLLFCSIACSLIIEMLKKVLKFDILQKRIFNMADRLEKRLQAYIYP